MNCCVRVSSCNFSILRVWLPRSLQRASTIQAVVLTADVFQLFTPCKILGIIRTCLMYHAACKVEFQPFKRLYSELTFFNFFYQILGLIIYQRWTGVPVLGGNTAIVGISIWIKFSYEKQSAVNRRAILQNPRRYKLDIIHVRKVHVYILTQSRSHLDHRNEAYSQNSMIDLRIIQFLNCVLLLVDLPTRRRRCPRTIKDQGMHL